MHNFYLSLRDLKNCDSLDPIFDLRKWGLADRESLLSGYVSMQPTGEDFKRVWNVVHILDTMIELSAKDELSFAAIEGLFAKF
jgi:hypothetical protein